jgi:hypothetical protein
MSGPEETEANRKDDPDALAKALEMELIMKRASWQKSRARLGTWRTLSFLFLFLVLLGALLAYFYFMTEARQRGGEKAKADQVESGR